MVPDAGLEFLARPRSGPAHRRLHPAGL